jgi:DNA repair protein RadA/Sms
MQRLLLRTLLFPGSHRLHRLPLAPHRRCPASSPAHDATLLLRRTVGRRTFHTSQFVCAALGGSGGGSKRGTGLVFLCTECGEDFPQSHGKCPACGEWDSLKPFNPAQGGASSRSGGGGAAQRAVARSRTALRDVADSGGAERRHEAKGGWVAAAGHGGGGSQPVPLVSFTALADATSSVGGGGAHGLWPLPGPLGAEVARVLGGGVVPGSLTLIGGDPGVGKSTLLLQLAQLLAAEGEGGGVASLPVSADVLPNAGVLYVSAEENERQVGSRASRLGCTSPHISIACMSSLDDILGHMAALRPKAVIIDSIQTVFLQDATGSAGSVSQVRECATALLHAAKGSGTAVFLVGHVTKGGDVAGPKTLEHLVDAVLYLQGSSGKALRLLRGVKNRYGPTNEVGMFDMLHGGLQPVSQPGSVYMSGGDASAPSDVASAVTVTLEGSRPVLMELQALCAKVGGGADDDEESGSGSRDDDDSPRQFTPPRRSALGIKPARLYQLLAVLSKRGLGGSRPASLGRHDVFVNVLGGVELDDPAGDLAVCAAVTAAFHDVALPPGVAYVAEVGLGGELRGVPEQEQRCKEALRWGFTRVVTAGRRGGAPGDAAGIVRCETVHQALAEVLGDQLPQLGGEGKARVRQTSRRA